MPRFFLHTLILILASAALSRAADGSLTLRAALARALTQSPELAAYDWEFRAAEARSIQAALKPNPELQFEVENPTGTGSLKNGEQMQTTLQFSQLIELGGKLPSRVAVAHAERTLVNWDYQVKRIEVLKGTTLAFVDVVAAQRRIALARDLVAVAEDAVQLTQQRLGVGKSGTVEATRANVAVASARIDLEQARSELLAGKARLAAQWGARTVDFEEAIGDLKERPETPSLDVLISRLLNSPQLLRWNLEREKRQAILTKEEAETRPNVTFAAGPRMEGRGTDATFVAGFSLPLPLRNRNQGNIAEARANLGKLDEERRAAEVRALAELSEAYQKIKGLGRELAILQETVIPGAQEAEKQLSEGYAAGRFTQLDVLETRKTLAEARTQQLKALAEYHKAIAEVEALCAQPVSLYPRSQTKAIRTK